MLQRKPGAPRRVQDPRLSSRGVYAGIAARDDHNRVPDEPPDCAEDCPSGRSRQDRHPGLRAGAREGLDDPGLKAGAREQSVQRTWFQRHLPVPRGHL